MKDSSKVAITLGAIAALILAINEPELLAAFLKAKKESDLKCWYT